MTIGAHQSASSRTTTWLTPPSIIDALGPFDLDPCCPPAMPWKTAALMLTKAEDGLFTPWPDSARVWLNPPYGTGEIEPWLEKMALHPGGGHSAHLRADGDVGVSPVRLALCLGASLHCWATQLPSSVRCAIGEERRRAECADRLLEGGRRTAALLAHRRGVCAGGGA